MLYFLGQLGGSLAAFNVFRYITFRTAGAVMTALFFVLGLLLLRPIDVGRGAREGLLVRDAVSNSSMLARECRSNPNAAGRPKI